ncbi:MAG: gamma-glutamyltransferase [Acidobacteriia bacterium]|nr:gamma-glutamyltransferase [Terriglobia bacterium]
MKSKLILVLVCLALCLTAQRQGTGRQVKRPVRGTRGAVAGGSEFATEAGMRMFHAGGNAVDAGAAATFAAAVTEYSHFGFGGEAPILIRTRQGKVISIAGIGPMPKLATAEYFRQRKLQTGEILAIEPGGVKGIIPVAGLMPAVVPGMVDAVLLALKEYGTKSAQEVMAPALELAGGAPLDETRAGAIARAQAFFELWPTSKLVFRPEGKSLRVGDLFAQPDLARTIRGMLAAEKRALASGAGRAAAIDAVRDYFYRGEVARKIDAFMRANNGLMRYEDLAALRLEPEEAATTTYRGYTVYKPGFWSQGPVLLQTLNLLEASDLRALMHNSPAYLHQLVESLKLAYADRDTYYGDPKFSPIPAERLLSKEYANQRRLLIGPQSSFEFRPGQVGPEHSLHPSEFQMVRTRIDDQLMASDTTCVNTMDKDGMVFSSTPSGAWLPSVIAGDTGIPLTQRAQSFLLVPGHPNELAGGKRPRITLSPTLVTQNGRPFLALSTPGGDNQDQALLQLLLNVVEFGMNAEDAVEAPRLQTRHLVSSFDNHAMNRGDLLLDERIPASTVTQLTSRGHKTAMRSRYGSGSAPVIIRMLPNGVIEAGADPYGYRAAQAW